MTLLLAFGPATGQEASWQRTGTGGGLQLDPTRHVDDPLTRALGEALGGLAGTIHNEAGARRALTVLAALGPAAESLPAGLEAQGRAYHVLGEFVLAERTYERWLTVAPADHTARTRMAVYLEQARNRREPMAPGETFRDCPDCPEMVVIPAGSFVMGVAPGEEEREGLPDLFKGHSVPQHGVNVRSFMLGKYEVTVGEFARFVNETGHRTDGGCHVWNGATWDIDQSRNWRNPGFGQGDRHPVACVSWDDAKAYTVWLSRKTGKGYRLATEAEWEYAARSGTSTARYWGNDANQGCGYANIADQTARSQVQGMTWGTTCGDGHAYTAPVGSFRMNGFGLHDMIGNVWEWTEDCWNENYAGAPTDGSSWQTGDCRLRVLRGGSWYINPCFARSANRFRNATGNRNGSLGFRVARTFN
jgi:formylglycine-generating enzyme required for sulfatase activity